MTTQRSRSRGAPSGDHHKRTDMLTAPSWQSAVLQSVPRGFLAHDWQPATGGRTFEVHNPATEEVITTVADSGAQDALRALHAVAAAADQPMPGFHI
ncbi:hypothetical protein PV367_41180 [Streptomyces europaeiscabiei]|uniref:Aldehyde dehydrogenase domain-containing protein n=1 Tax=Streptomyces europaeiscabiei TaxID=146819 RepID=A0AAJ2PYE2_9ACTN|nr:hypothetical protein [Streptomyces europaeiscabiei]MDX3136068.1 hypothetical protein [Streptomyces europaeiscabiei]